MKFAHRVPPEGVKFENMNIGHAIACINAASREEDQAPALMLLHSAWMSLKDAYEDTARDTTARCAEACMTLFHQPSVEHAEALDKAVDEMLAEITVVRH